MAKSYMQTDINKIMHSLRFETASTEEPYTKYYTPKEGHLVIDGGAHVGIYTRKFSKLVGSYGRVFAFEPDYRALGLLTLNTEDCSNIRVLPYALWNEDEIISFNTYNESIGMSSCIVSYKGGETYPVYAVKLDTILKRLNLDMIPINFIKMDIEASEIRALHGMVETLKHTEALAIAAYHKIDPKDELYKDIKHKMRDKEKTFKDVKRILIDAGFKVRVEQGHDGEIVYANRD